MKFISKYIILRRIQVGNFADIIKVETIFIKATFRDSKKVKRIINFLLKMQCISVFLDITKFVSFRRKYAGVSRTHWDVSRDLHILGSS